jgi:hypothetical protein
MIFLVTVLFWKQDVWRVHVSTHWCVNVEDKSETYFRWNMEVGVNASGSLSSRLGTCAWICQTLASAPSIDQIGTVVIHNELISTSKGVLLPCQKKE